MKRTKATAVAVLLGVFALGALSGAAATYGYTQRQFAQMAGPQFQQRRLWALARKLNLTSTQRKEIREIFDRYRTQRQEILMQVMDQCGKPMIDQKAQIDSEIRKVLTPEQQTEFDNLARRQNEQFFRGPPGHRGRRFRGGN